jgi:DNA repair protein RadC
MEQKDQLLNQLAEVTVSYNPKVKPSQRIKISNSKNAEEVLRKVYKGDLEYREKFYILLLNRANKVLGWCKISEGGITGSVADVRLIFQTALKTHATSIILCHNHPSGNLNPSDADIELTRRIREAGKILDIQVLDHLIITAESYFSFADDGII